MFKLTGSILIIAAIASVTTEKVIKSYFTYNYLSEVISLLYLLKDTCQAGKTYSTVTDSLDKRKFRLLFDKNKEYILDRQRLDKTRLMFTTLGRKNKKEETEMLQYYILQTEKECSEYKNYFDKNMKTVLGSGIYIALVIIIVLF